MQFQQCVCYVANTVSEVWLSVATLQPKMFERAEATEKTAWLINSHWLAFEGMKQEYSYQNTLQRRTIKGTSKAPVYTSTAGVTWPQFDCVNHNSTSRIKIS